MSKLWFLSIVTICLSALLQVKAIAKPCLEIEKFQGGQYLIKEDECVVYKGQEEINLDLAVLGKLTIRSNAVLNLVHSKMLLSKQGELINHGSFSLKEGSSLALYLDSSFKNTLGHINVIELSHIYVQDGALLHNGGQITLKDQSSIKVKSMLEFKNNGSISLIDSSLIVSAKGLVNDGNMEFFSSLLRQEYGSVVNNNKITLAAQSKHELKSEASFNNLKNYYLEAFCEQEGQVVNEGIMEIKEGASYTLKSRAELQNKRSLILMGRLFLLDEARINSKALIFVKPQGQITMLDGSYLFNNGTLRNQGSLEGREHLINNQILFEDDKTTQP